MKQKGIDWSKKDFYDAIRRPDLRPKDHRYCERHDQHYYGPWGVCTECVGEGEKAYASQKDYEESEGVSSK